MLFLMATTQAVTCSAALLTIGIRIGPMKLLLRLEPCAIPSMLYTRASAQMETTTVVITSTVRAAQEDRAAVSRASPWTSDSGRTLTNRSLRVRSWKTM